MQENNPNKGKNIQTKDIPAGSSLAKELNVSYGDIDFVETTGENFIWAQSIHGIGRIGENKNNG
jgi:hypothetical protein